MTSIALREDRCKLPSPEEESYGLRRLQMRMVRTSLRQTLTTARLRLCLVVTLSMLLWLGLFFLMREGFLFLKTTIPQPTHDQIVHAVFGTFFAALLLMLLFSSGLILYSSLFRSREVALLLTFPIRDERVFLHKFQESAILSGWGFLLLGSPMLVAYGVVSGASWYYYALMLPLMIAFVYIPVGLAAILCLEILYRVPGKRMLIVGVMVLLVIGAAVWFFWSVVARPESDLLTPRWFQDMLGRLQLTEQRLLPSWWLSSGVLETARGAWSEGVLFLTLLISNALFCRQLAVWTAAQLYRRTYSRIAGTGHSHRRARIAWFDHALGRMLGFLPRPVRLMLIKDLRLFRRDPIQWSQFLILFALLGLYFLNVRRFTYTVNYSAWVSMVSFMNLSVVGLLMSTFTTRFIFPMISLESRRFWLLGLLPLPRGTILWSKFLFATGSLIAPCSLLILLSDSMLQVSPMMLANHQWTCMLLCLGLSGIAVGLSARLPNLREQSPARIAAGFGGTLNLVISTLFIIAVEVLTTLPCHFYLAARKVHEAVPTNDWVRLGSWLWIWLIGGTLASLVLCVVATAVPMWIGFRTFRQLEF